MVIEDSIKTCFKKYFSTQGRASRSEFWWFAVLSGMFHFIQNIIIVFYFWDIEEFTWGHLLHWAAAIIVGIPCCTVAVRRMHDVNVSSLLGWVGAISTICLLYAVALGCSLVLVLFYLQLGNQAQENITDLGVLFLIACAYCSLTFLVFSLFKGTAGPNKYGPDPLAVKSEKAETAGSLAPSAAQASQAPAAATSLSQAPATLSTGDANAQPAPFSQQPPEPTSAPPVDTSQDNIPQVQLKAAELEQLGYVELTPEQIEQLQALRKAQDQKSTIRP